MKNSVTWWEETKNDKTKLHHWLQRQYIGEFSAVHLLATLLVRFGSEISFEYRTNIYNIILQEAQHGQWMSALLNSEGIEPETGGKNAEKYWKSVLPNVTDFKSAMQACAQAEVMRLYRIRAIIADESAPPLIRTVFERILPHEEWHALIFKEMQGQYFSQELADANNEGLAALNLVLE